MILIALLLIGAGAWLGWQACRRFLYKRLMDENSYLLNHNQELKLTMKYWQEQSAYNKNEHNSTITNHNSNLKNTLESVLFYLQNQSKETLKSNEKEQIEGIIKSIKSGISYSAVE